jgi:multidrug efflux pump subunit AcrB
LFIPSKTCVNRTSNTANNFKWIQNKNNKLTGKQTMRIPKLAIENHQFTIVLMILLILFGLASYFTMPRSEDPMIHPAGSTVVAIYPGADPADMEELVIDPIEEALNELEDIKQINSSAEDGLAMIAIEFVSGSDPDEKYSDVVQKVNSVNNDLPEGILDLEITKWSINDVNILQMALVSNTASYREMELEAERLKKDLEKIAGVKGTDVLAYPKQEIRVSLNPEKLAGANISFQQVLNAIQSANQNIPGGNIDIGAKRFNLKSSGSYRSIRDIENTIVHSGSGKVVYLKDVADVTRDYQDLTYFARYNGNRAVYVTVTQKENTNIFGVMKDVRKEIADFKSKLPTSMSLAMVFDQSQSVSQRVNKFFGNLLQGLLLVGFVVLMAVSFRAAIIVILVIPISILTATGLIDLTNYGLQQMTITGFVIALGLLVDNAIVVTENIARFLKMGYPRQEAAVRGTAQIAWAIVSSTVTTVLAFVPMMMLGSVTGDFIRSMPVTVVYALGASLFISLTLTPYLSSKFLVAANGGKEKRLRRFLNHLVEHRYRRTLKSALEHPKRTVSIALLVFLASLALFPLVGISFFPKAEKPQLMVNINTPDGTSLYETDRIARAVETELLKINEVKGVASNIGRGNPRIYYNVVPEREKSTHAQLFVQLKNYDLEAFSQLLENLRQRFSEYPGAKIEVKEFEQGPPVEAPVAIRILGDNLQTLQHIAGDVEKMISGTAGTVNVKNPLATPKADLHLRINRDKAGIFGVPLVEIDRTVRASIAGLTASEFRDKEGKEYDIVLRLPVQQKANISDLDKIYVSSVTGAEIPLKQLAAVEFAATPMEIDHHNLERQVTLTADVLRGVSVDKVTRDIIQKLNKYDWQKGYKYQIGGELESREESFGGMFKAILIAMIAIFAVLVLQFKSYQQPLIVFSAIPLAVIGSILALLLTGNSFSFSAFVGLTSLVGIVVNNSIILVDYTNQLRADGKAKLEAIKEAAETRFMPIVLTTATTIGGLLPLTLGGGTLWAPMGWTIIGGLIASTMLTLLLVPVLYRVFSR